MMLLGNSLKFRPLITVATVALRVAGSLYHPCSAPGQLHSEGISGSP